MQSKTLSQPNKVHSVPKLNPSTKTPNQSNLDVVFQNMNKDVNSLVSINASTSTYFNESRDVTVSHKTTIIAEDIEQEDGEQDPPPTPQSIFDFENEFTVLHGGLGKKSLFDMEELPLVRKDGVKATIERLGEYFGCKDYQFNMYQFWFLDIVTDCIWRVQDEFGFPENLQKVVIEWVIFVFERIKDPRTNYSRKEMFKLVKEAVLMASEVVDEGCPELPLPQQLFEVVGFGEEECKSFSDSDFSTTSSCSWSSDDDDLSYVQLELDKETFEFALPKEFCNCQDYVFSSENESACETSVKDQLEDDVSEEQETEETVEFYKPDHEIPSRFLPLPEEEEKPKSVESHSDSCLEESMEEEDMASTKIKRDIEEQEENTNKLLELQSSDADVKELKDQYEIVSLSGFSESIPSPPTSLHQPSNLTFARSQSNALKTVSSKYLSQQTSKMTSMKSIAKSQMSVELNAKPSATNMSVKESDIMKALKEYYLWEERLKNMRDSKIGWMPSKEEVLSVKEALVEEDLSDEDEWIDVVENGKKEGEAVEAARLVNFGVLWAVIHFIFDYFFDSFQFKLIRMAFNACPNLITQKINEEWNVPKGIKQESLKPPKPKVEKKKKEKKEKKKGKDKKKGKEKSKSKTKSKSSKTKSTGKAKKGKEKKGKKEKRKPLTKEEKEELERLKREEEAMEEERLRLMENKRYMFPLLDAASDELFMNIFDDWVKTDLTALTEKGKKGKKDKKSSKGSKKK